ncbi:hypothetical protein [Mariniblastus fucicola]|uniref:Uncharacterized protein n=1 Tax=Mariniblastus fucicola TaxID=980251 RepID=A0A5B9PEH0_9BACT|nr:hypothetical protein [Mariniblastus fucicola]QEG23899.1 hypothetical protein MFFC18_38030 [Mariniblastus fucicola]
MDLHEISLASCEQLVDRIEAIFSVPLVVKRNPNLVLELKHLFSELSSSHSANDDTSTFFAATADELMSGFINDCFDEQSQGESSYISFAAVRDQWREWDFNRDTGLIGGAVEMPDAARKPLESIAEYKSQDIQDKFHLSPKQIRDWSKRDDKPFIYRSKGNFYWVDLAAPELRGLKKK